MRWSSTIVVLGFEKQGQRVALVDAVARDFVGCCSWRYGPFGNVRVVGLVAERVHSRRAGARRLVADLGLALLLDSSLRGHLGPHTVPHRLQPLQHRRRDVSRYRGPLLSVGQGIGSQPLIEFQPPHACTPHTHTQHRRIMSSFINWAHRRSAGVPSARRSASSRSGSAKSSVSSLHRNTATYQYM